MWIRFGVCLVAACLWSTAAAGARAAAAAPTNDDCLTCHGDADAKRADGRIIAVDARRFEGSIHGPLTCVDCHADAGKELPHPDALAKVACGSCHEDVAGKYHDSMHAWAKDKAGLVGAPSCADCHGKHDITPHTVKTSRVYRDQIPATCGGCHAGVREKYERGVHAAALKKGASAAPVCVDCHTTHAILRTDNDKWRLSVTSECGTCHERVASFRRTFHGKVTELGFTRVAACADCHGAHDILPASNRASMVSKARLVETCGRCHPGANERFVQYDPHPNPSDYSRGAVLWWANRFYWLLIPGCFGFFGLHSALWYLALEEGRRTSMTNAVLEPPVPDGLTPPPAAAAVPTGAAAEAALHLARFDRPTRVLHAVIMVTFLGLSATGMPLLFSDAGWARLLASLFGGFHGAGLVHRFFGAALLGAVAWHLANIGYRAFIRGEAGLLWGPTSMVPQPRDFTDLYGNLKWFVGLGPRPRFEHFAYWEKFDYWAVLWGTALMGAAGLVLWFPVAASRILPGWMFNVALFVHGAEASLAIGFIFVVHFFNGHLRPGKFPMDLVIFTGSVPVEELRHERAAEYERLQRSGTIDSLSVAAPRAAARRRGYVVGTVGLTLGIALVGLIIFAMMR